MVPNLPSTPRAALVAVGLVLAVLAMPSPAVAERPRPEPPSKSMLLAGTLAVGGVVAALGLGDLSVRTGSAPLGLVALGGLIVGPSAGHFYAGATDHAIITSLARAASFGLILVATGESDRSRNLAEVGQAVGGFGFLGLIIYSAVDAPFAARRFNRRARAAATSVGPTLIPVVGGTAPGLSLRGVF